ncbi:copia protein, partial [Tanacetum coccineum]
VSTGSGPVSSARGQREGKAPMIVEETQAPKRTKEQIQQEEASLAEAIRLQTLEEEETAKQVYLDALLAKRMEEEELTEQQKKRKAQSVLGKELPEEDFAKKMVELVNQRKKFFAEERAKARRTTKEQLKRYGEELQTEISKKQRFDNNDVSVEEKVTEVKEEEPVIRTGKRKKQKVRKGINVDKSPQGDSETNEEESVEAMNPSPLDTKSNIVANWKIFQQGGRSIYQIIRANRADTVYISFGAMLKDFTREDLIELYRTMFDPPLNDDAIWSLPLQQKIINRKYPLSKDACQVMLKMKLLDGKMNEVCYKLLKMIEKQVGVKKHSMDVQMKGRSNKGNNTVLHDNTALHNNTVLHDNIVLHDNNVLHDNSTARTFDNGEIELTTTIDGKVKIVTEVFVRRHLQLADSDVVQGEGSTHPVESHHTPISAPSTSQPLILPTTRRTNIQESVVPQPRSPTQTPVADEAASTGVDVRYGGATTTANSQTKEQIRQEEAGLEEAIKLQAQMDEEVAKQIHLDEMIAKRMAEEEALSKQQKKRKAQVQFEAQYYTEEDWDAIRAKLEANAELTKDVLGKDLPEQDFAKRMVDMIDDKDVPAIEEKVAEVKEEEPVKRTGKRKKQKSRKGISVDKNAQGDSKTDKEESVEAMNHTPLVIKSNIVVNWKIFQQGQRSVYQIMRANGADTVYMSFGAMIKDFTREDLIELYRLVMQKYGTNRPEDAYDRVLWSDLRTMFDPPLNEDAIWSLPLQQKMVSWRYYDKCAVHCLTLEASTIYMLADRKYPLSKDACQVMLKMKLLDGTMDEVCYKLLKMIEKQAGIRK